MDITISPARSVHGNIMPPGDKSISHRAAIFGALAQGTTDIYNYSPARDCQSTLECLLSLGTGIRRDGNYIRVEGVGDTGFKEPESILDCGNSGTTMRLLIGALAPMDLYAVLIGDKSLTKRPMDRVLKPLGDMGLRYYARNKDRYPPVSIRGGKIQGIHYQTPVASAQVKSAILLAGLRAEGETVVTEPAKSRDHTERMLKAMGAQIQSDGTTVRLVASRLSATTFHVPADPSSAAFILAAALIVPESKVTTSNICLNPTRIGFLNVLERMGANIEIHNERESSGEPIGDIEASTSELNGIEIGGTEIPTLIDEIPILAVLATQAKGRTVIRDAEELRIKETDRISVLCRALQQMGADIREMRDGFEIHGPCKLKGAKVDPDHDHRIAMALAVASLIAEDKTTILGAECASISYPNFWDHLSSLGVELSGTQSDSKTNV
ncbi:3-phosphoshikimate 1-carboxyvinyltransferase [Thermobaculum terrenum ATCC BAA-798]|uniref:3-phosphoshikimate 1-carboxyvinyltransferase n=1 Tax=Thermobaculum terrenum (strain ATCC BAA-798 / CCMEE 7001 / YNP1) TaxID=525904 RepID=D1CDM3_THET1|nr:3-phosphoshikimate 1-carboxyvinyltransferase [Thermobaculum terrenum]ACZ41029.1 3-phosphoshikimate 1-carboxyvinyltransferase [Thermobaculum terrenum ATCC BAA-798]